MQKILVLICSKYIFLCAKAHIHQDTSLAVYVCGFHNDPSHPFSIVFLQAIEPCKRNATFIL